MEWVEILVAFLELLSKYADRFDRSDGLRHQPAGWAVPELGPQPPYDDHLGIAARAVPQEPLEVDHTR